MQRIEDRRDALKAAAAHVRDSLDEPFRRMDSDAIMAFLRPDDDPPQSAADAR